MNIFREFSSIAMGLTVFATSIGAISARGDDKPVQTVTYADFGFVNSVASSIKHVYFATTGGITRYNKVEDRWDEPLTGTYGFASQEVKRVWVDTFDEKLYALTDIGMYELDLFFDRWFPISEFPRINRSYRHTNPPEDILPPAGENYFGKGKFSDRYGRTYSVSDMIEDQNGFYWIGTWGRGPARASNSSRVVEPLPFGLMQNYVGSIYVEDSLLWLSGRRERQLRTGITGFNPTTLRSILIETGVDTDLPEVDVNCLFGDEHFLYAGTEAGLLILERTSEQVVRELKKRHGLADDRVTCLSANGDTLFVGTRSGYSMIIDSRDSVAAVYPGVFGDKTIYDMEIVGKHLWIGSSVGAYRLALSSFKLQSFKDPDAFLFSQVYDIESEGDNIWFSSDGGLLRLNRKTGKSQVFQSQSSIQRKRVIAVNDSIAVINSDRGITIFYLHDNRGRVAREFSIEDGLASEYVYSLYLDGDYLWIGSDKGLTRLLWNNPRRVD